MRVRREVLADEQSELEVGSWPATMERLTEFCCK